MCLTLLKWIFNENLIIWFSTVFVHWRAPFCRGHRSTVYRWRKEVLKEDFLLRMINDGVRCLTINLGGKRINKLQTDRLDQRVRNEEKESEDGAVVKALASHQCGRGSTLGLDVTCEFLRCSERFFPEFPLPSKSILRFDMS